MSNDEDGKSSDDDASQSLAPRAESRLSPAKHANAAPPAVRETVVVLSLSSRKVKRALFIFLLVVFLPFALYTGKRQYHFHIFHKALTQVIEGHGAMASEILDPWREDFVATEAECELILNAYTLGAWMERLQWAAEACGSNAIETASVHIATARFLAANGELDEAERSLHKAAFKFKNAKAAVMLARLYVSRKKDEEALQILETAMLNMPGNATLVLHAIQINTDLKRYLRADQIAETNIALRGSREEPELEKVILEAVTRVGKDIRQVGTGLSGQPSPSQPHQEQLLSRVLPSGPQPGNMPNQMSGSLPIKLPSAELLSGLPKRSGHGSGGGPPPEAMGAQRPAPMTPPPATIPDQSGVITGPRLPTSQ